jgi:hypothetical protein
VSKSLLFPGKRHEPLFREARFRGRRVYIVYFDDGGKGNVLVFGGIVVDHNAFVVLEANVGILASALMPPGKDLTEFHASDLFRGEGEFKDIPESDRHKALLHLLRVVGNLNLPYIYSAIDKHRLSRTPTGSANVHDVAFRMVAAALEDFLVSQIPVNSAQGIEYPLCLLIVDDCDRAPKEYIKKSFRQMRQPMRMPLDSTGWSNNRLSHSVDDLFFGDSSGSVGLQVADVCNYVMWRRLAENIEDEFFAELMKGQVICAKPEPEWSAYRHLFRAHDA